MASPEWNECLCVDCVRERAERAEAQQAALRQLNTMERDRARERETYGKSGLEPAPESKAEYVLLDRVRHKPLHFLPPAGPGMRGYAVESTAQRPPTKFPSLGHVVSYLMTSTNREDRVWPWSPSGIVIARVVPGKRVLAVAEKPTGSWVLRVMPPIAATLGSVMFARAVFDETGQIQWGDLDTARVFTDADLPSMGRRLAAYGFWLAKEKKVDRPTYHSIVPVQVGARDETYEEVR